MKNYAYVLAAVFFFGTACRKEDKEEDKDPLPLENICESDQFKFHFIDGLEYNLYGKYTTGWEKSTGTYKGNECDSTSEFLSSSGSTPPLFRTKKDYVMYVIKMDVLYEDSDSILLDPNSDQHAEWIAFSYR